MADSSLLTLGRAKSVLIPAILSISSAAMAHGVDRWSSQIADASARFDIPEAWIRRVMGAESGGEPLFHGRPVVSRAGALGLMQLMPGTWRHMRAWLGLGPDPNDPGDNIIAGAAYLKLMYLRFGYPGLFGAYNAGPARYSAFLHSRLALPAETRAYIAALAPRSRLVSASLSNPGVFASGRHDRPHAPPAFAPPVKTMFVALSSNVVPVANGKGQAAVRR